MSAQIVEMNDDVSKDTAPEKAPDPITQNLNNNQTTKAIGADMRLDEERIPGMVKESTVWDVYNNEARKVDNELVKDWTASLNFLLVLAAIFAAVLSAFIIESKKMLEADQTEILVDITIQYFNSISNPSRANLTRPAFEPTSTAISINCCLFASLGVSLVAAFASVVSLQWVADYDAAITRGGSSPEDRAKRRQFRHAGVLRWKMGEIITALPLLLYSSVILFWAGAIQWMWTLHHIVGYVVAGGTAIAVFFYASTTILGAVYVSSPFRTPLSKCLHWLFRCLVSLLGQVLLRLPIEGLLRGFTWLYRNISSLKFATVPTDRGSSDPWSLSAHPVHPSLAETIPEWIKTHLINETSRHPENDTEKQDAVFQQEALAWLAEQLPITADAHNRLLLFARGMLALPRDTPLSPQFLETPWLAILDFLCAHYMQKIFDPSTSVEDYEGLDMLLQLIDHPCIRTKVVPGPHYEDNPRKEMQWYFTVPPQPARLAMTYELAIDAGTSDFITPTLPEDRVSRGFALAGSIMPTRPEKLASMTFLLARDVPVPLLGSKYELDATTKLIRWRNSVKFRSFLYGDAIWSEVFSGIQHYSPGFFESCLRHFQMVPTIKDGYFGRPEAPEIFRLIVTQALSRVLTVGEAVALAQAFEVAVTNNIPSYEPVDTASPIVHPIRYGFALKTTQEVREIHYAITLLVARAAESAPKDEWPNWARWIVLMLWIGSPKELGYWETLREDMSNWAYCRARDLWGKVDMTIGGLPIESPHIEETVASIAELIEAGLNGRVGKPLWINSRDPNEKRFQLMRLLDTFDKLMVIERGEKWRRTAVGLICDEMHRAGVQWPSPIANPETQVDLSNNLEDHRQQLIRMNDSCLTMMGAFACGVQPSVELALSNNYQIQDREYLQILHNLVYKNHCVHDSPALWEFRAAVTPVASSAPQRYFGDPWSDPQQLACLQLLLQCPAPCHAHSTSFQHLFIHLHQYAIANQYRIVGLDHFEHLPFYDIDGIFFNPVLVLLALADTQALTFISWRGGGHIRFDHMQTICNEVKSQPAEFFRLIVDIIAERATRSCRLADMLVILEAVEQACELPEDETTTSFLHPLASALQQLLGQLTDSEALRTASRRGTIVYEARRICGILQTRSHRNLILSTSHLRIISCVRSVAVVRPATGWLGMHVDL